MQALELLSFELLRHSNRYVLRRDFAPTFHLISLSVSLHVLRQGGGCASSTMTCPSFKDDVCYSQVVLGFEPEESSPKWGKWRCVEVPYVPTAMFEGIYIHTRLTKG